MESIVGMLCQSALLKLHYTKEKKKLSINKQHADEHSLIKWSMSAAHVIMQKKN